MLKMALESRSFENTKTFKFLSEYFSSCSLHGVKYLGEPSRPYWERIFWITILCLSLYGSTNLTLQVWEKWQNHPIIISFTDKTTAISKIPFPALTICPTNNVKMKTFNLAKNYWTVLDGNITMLSQEEREILEALSISCQLEELDKYFNENRIFAKEIIPLLERVKPSLGEHFHKCMWKGKPHPCNSIWTESLTVFGICYTFNSMGSENLLRNEASHTDFITTRANLSINWDSEKGYIEKKEKDIRFPRRVLSAGFDIGMELDLIGRSEDTFLFCEGYSPGFLLFLHPPNDYPDGERNHVRISFGQEVLIAVKPNMQITSSKLRNYSPQKRQCYFSHEKYLRFFKIYTQNNCEIECLGNYSLSMCNCVPFYIPRLSNTPVCRLKDQECFENASQEMMLTESEDGMCKCLPGCVSLTYGMEVSFSDIYQPKNAIALKENNTNWNLRADCVIYFKEDQFWMSKRSETYGITELLANCGGVLGLFMGFSVLSLNEIFYLLTFRLTRFLRQK